MAVRVAVSKVIYLIFPDRIQQKWHSAGECCEQLARVYELRGQQSEGETHALHDGFHGQQVHKVPNSCLSVSNDALRIFIQFLFNR